MASSHVVVRRSRHPLASVPAHRRPRFLRLSALSAHALAALLIGSAPPPARAQVPRGTTVPLPPTEAEEITRLIRTKDLDGALKRADAFLVKNPRDLQVRFLRAVIFSDQGKTADAIAAFEALTQDFPELPEPYNNLAVLYASQGEYDKARNALEMSIRTHPSYATAHENLGDIYAKMAAEAYDKALQRDKTNTAAQTKLELIKEIFSGGTRTRPSTTGKADIGKPAATTVAAAKPAPHAPAAVAKPTAADASGEVIKTVDGWARAWSENNVSGYLGYYAPDFETPAGEPRSDWEAARKARIAKPKKIQVTVEAPKVKFTSANRVTVTFRQNYRSPGLKVASTKTLVMVKTGERWLIQQERVGG